MKLIKGKTYTSDITDLSLWVLNVHYETNDYYKVKGVLINKQNHIIYETKNYKLFKDKISNWYALED